MRKSFFIVVLILLGSTISLFGQSKHAYWDKVQTIKKYDKIYDPPAHPILFIGSSSIRFWPNLQKTFCNHIVLNRGLGGSVINDWIYYADDLIFPYHPRQIIMYIGENDEIDPDVTAEEILNRFKKLYHLLRSKLPDIPIDYISMKPSPVREQYWGKEKKANELIANFLKKQENAGFIDIWPLFVTKDGRPKRGLFRKHMLHMNAKGYAIWDSVLSPYLINE